MARIRVAKPRTWRFWAIVWGVAAMLYFFVPLYGTLDFSLRMKRGEISLLAYELVFADPRFWEGFRYSTVMALVTIALSALIFVPTVYWMHLRLPQARPIVELVTILPFIIPGIVYVFGLIRTYSRPPLQLTLQPLTTDMLIAAGYVVLSMPYMFRAVDIGMRSIDVRTLTEAAQSLGASRLQLLLHVILPNIRTAVLGGGLLCFATVMGELILASFMVRPALGPYMQLLGLAKAYEPAALAIISFALTWLSLGALQFLARGSVASQQVMGR